MPRKTTLAEKKKRVSRLKKGYVLRDKSVTKDLPASVRKGAAERHPRVLTKTPRTKGPVSSAAKALHRTGGKALNLLIQGPRKGKLTDSPGIIGSKYDKKGK